MSSGFVWNNAKYDIGNYKTKIHTIFDGLKDERIPNYSNSLYINSPNFIQQCRIKTIAVIKEGIA